MSQQDQQPLNIESPNSTDNTSTSNNISVPKLCIAGCGFFGNAASEWHCSKCFKAKQQKLTGKPPQHTSAPSATTSPAPAIPLTVGTTASALATNEPHLHQPSFKDVTTLLQTIQRSATPIPVEVLSPSPLTESDAQQLDAAVVTAQVHAQPAVVPAVIEKPVLPAPATIPAIETQSITSVTSPFKKVKCMVCNKKLGAMSYQTCRCSSDENGIQIPGRVFCNDHRHTWTHSCSVDVKKLQQTVLTQANPEIKSNNGLERI